MSKPSCDTNRNARSIRRGSSLNDSSAAIGVRRILRPRSLTPSNGSTAALSGNRIAIAFTVKSRRDRSVSMFASNVTSGCLDEGMYFSVRKVVISIGTPSIRHPMVPNFSP
jgi:hypothetical protein